MIGMIRDSNNLEIWTKDKIIILASLQGQIQDTTMIKTLIREEEEISEETKGQTKDSTMMLITSEANLKQCHLQLIFEAGLNFLLNFKNFPLNQILL